MPSPIVYDLQPGQILKGGGGATLKVDRVIRFGSVSSPRDMVGCEIIGGPMDGGSVVLSQQHLDSGGYVLDQASDTEPE